MFSFWELIKWIGKTHKLKACFRSATLKTTIKQTGLHVSTKPGHTLSIFSFYVGYRWKIDGNDLRSTACHAHWGRKSVDIVNVGFGFFMKKVSTSSEQKKKHGSTWATSQDNWNDYEQWWGQNQTKSFYNDIKTNMIDLCCEFSYRKAISNKLSLPRKGFNKACLGPHGNKPVS